MSDSVHTFADITRESLDREDIVAYSIKTAVGLSEEVVRAISISFAEPQWMLDIRLASLAKYRELPMPTWWPDLSHIDLEDIHYFARPEGATDTHSWDDVPDTIKATFDRLGIPEAEKKILAGVGAQYDSEVVYHSLREDLQAQGVIFVDMSIALRDYPDMVRKYFMKCVPIGDHKFAALHGAVWSGGTFLYIPAGVHISDPLQAYFRMNVQSGGQFEHTLIVVEDGASAHYIEGCSAPKYGTASLHAGCVEVYVGEGASMRYSSVENWSTDTYNLNTKRSIVQKNGKIEWIGWNLGSGVTMLYPCSVLVGDHSSARHLGIAFANTGQNTDTGAKVIHIGKHTSSEVISKSLSKGWGNAIYRGLIDIKKSAVGAVSRVDCDGLILDSISKSETIPDIRVAAADATVAHEASVGKISEDILFYMQSRWLTDENAKTLVVNGFLSPLVRELPLEYAAELNVLIAIEMEGAM